MSLTDETFTTSSSGGTLFHRASCIRIRLKLHCKTFILGPHRTDFNLILCLAAQKRIFGLRHRVSGRFWTENAIQVCVCVCVSGCGGVGCCCFQQPKVKKTSSLFFIEVDVVFGAAAAFSVGGYIIKREAPFFSFFPTIFHFKMRTFNNETV